MKIFITGATGYIGFAVAVALAARGHEVFGLVRSEEKAKKIIAAEIIPVIGSMNKPESYVAIAGTCDLAIHCAAELSEDFHILDRKTVEVLIKATLDKKLRRKIIYTSGVWLYGNTGYQLMNENSSLHPPHLVKPRAETEKILLHANTPNLHTLVIRPGCVYGGTGGMSSDWFQSTVTEGSPKIIGNGSNRWSMVHVQDLADLYVRVAESHFANEIFNGTDHSRFTVLECAQSINRLMNKNEKVHIISESEAEKKLGLLAECMLLDQHIDSSKASRLLQWQPKHGGFVDGVSRYFSAWNALN